MNCPKCNTLMLWDGAICTSNPPKYMHQCPKCGYVEYLDTPSATDKSNSTIDSTQGKITMIDKAIEYDKALERAKQIQNTPYTAHWDIMKEVVEYLFPQLKESEDERIRKEIKQFIRSRGMSLAQSKVDSWIAWLEKQGEQKSMKTCAEYYNQDNELKMPELSEFQNKLADILMYREYDGPDETEDDIAKGRLEYELAAIRLSEELLPLAQKEQKPAWSEEDEERLRDIINELVVIKEDANVRCSERALNDIIADINWLKSLRPQNWTKEDKERYISCLQKLSTGNPEQPETINSKWFKEHVYPKLQWKPSDELPHWKRITIPNHDVTGFNSENFTYKGYYINYIELFEKLPKDD